MRVEWERVWEPEDPSYYGLSPDTPCELLATCSATIDEGWVSTVTIETLCLWFPTTKQFRALSADQMSEADHLELGRYVRGQDSWDDALEAARYDLAARMEEDTVDGEIERAREGRG